VFSSVCYYGHLWLLETFLFTSRVWKVNNFLVSERIFDHGLFSSVGRSGFQLIGEVGNDQIRKILSTRETILECYFRLSCYTEAFTLLLISWGLLIDILEKSDE